MPQRRKQEARDDAPPREAKMGDNTEAGGIAAERLRSIVDRIERLEEEKRELASDIKDVMQEAKSAGFDTKTVREVLRRRRMDPAEREERDMLRDLYERALELL
jgi:uncharacterized protein (UPF0335 family)